MKQKLIDCSIDNTGLQWNLTILTQNLKRDPVYYLL